MQRFKKIAVSYFQNGHLPVSFGDTHKITLGEMLVQKLLVPLVDQNQEEYDHEESYAQITHLGNEYLIKLNLKERQYEAYIWVYLGDYDYCDAFCEKYNSF